MQAHDSVYHGRKQKLGVLVQMCVELFERGILIVHCLLDRCHWDRLTALGMGDAGSACTAECREERDRRGQGE